MPAKDSFESRPFKPSADRPAEPEPTIVYTTEIQEPATVAAWWVGGLVTIVAILAATFVVTRHPDTDQQIANAVAQQRLQGALESAPLSPAAAEPTGAQNDTSAADAAQVAAANADRSAHQAAISAESASAAAVDASARVPDPTAVRTANTASSEGDDAR